MYVCSRKCLYKMVETDMLTGSLLESNLYRNDDFAEVLGLYIAPEIYIHVLIEYEYQSWYEFRYSLTGIEYWDVIS